MGGPKTTTVLAREPDEDEAESVVLGSRRVARQVSTGLHLLESQWASKTYSGRGEDEIGADCI